MTSSLAPPSWYPGLHPPAQLGHRQPINTAGLGAWGPHCSVPIGLLAVSICSSPGNLDSRPNFWCSFSNSSRRRQATIDPRSPLSPLSPLAVPILARRRSFRRKLTSPSRPRRASSTRPQWRASSPRSSEASAVRACARPPPCACRTPRTRPMRPPHPSSSRSRTTSRRP